MKSDMQLQWDVSTALSWAPSVDGTGISVTVQDGIVTLSGSVGSYIAKWEAERAAGRVAGVRALVAELRVNLVDLNWRSDADIARAAANALDRSAYLPRNSVRVMVDKGQVTLRGKVEWGYQRDAVIAAIRSLTGVTGVGDNIIIEPRVAVTDSWSQIGEVRTAQARCGTGASSLEVLR